MFSRTEFRQTFCFSVISCYISFQWLLYCFAVFCLHLSVLRWNSLWSLICMCALQGAAIEDGRLKRGDQIIAVNGHCLEGVTHAEAVDILKKTKGTVVLTVLSWDAAPFVSDRQYVFAKPVKWCSCLLKNCFTHTTWEGKCGKWYSFV